MNQLKRNYKKYKKINRYVEKKTAIENLKLDFQSLLGINHEDEEALEKRINRQKAMNRLVYLIGVLLFERNPYEIKQEIRDYKLIEEWFQQYDIDIFSVTKENIDVLEEIIKKI